MPSSLERRFRPGGGTGAALAALAPAAFGSVSAAKEVCREDVDACPNSQILHHETLRSSARGARAEGFTTLTLGLIGVGVSAVWLLASDGEDANEGSLALSGSVGSGAALLDCSLRF